MKFAVGSTFLGQMVQMVGVTVRINLLPPIAIIQITMNRPLNSANESEILAYAKWWVKLAADKGFEVALSELEPNPNVPWSQGLFEQITFDHFDDGRQPVISDPSINDDLRVEAYEYNDGSGFAVDHDLPLDGMRSDLTVQFDFRKGSHGYLVYLDDIHVL